MKSEKQMYVIAGGSVPGSDHIRVGKNNHDAYFLCSGEDYAVGVVTDGCGSGKHSEVGAKIAAKILGAELTAVAELCNKTTCDDAVLERYLSRATQKVLSQLSVLVQSFRGSYSESVKEYLLFTVLAVVMTRDSCFVVGLGDGVYAINGEVKEIGPFPNNAPPYLAYGLTGSDSVSGPFTLQLFESKPANEVQSVMIATDGMIDFLAISNQRISARNLNQIGDLSQFWREDSFFSNPDKVRRRLAMINVMAIDEQPGFNPRLVYGRLHDDTTLVVVRNNTAIADGDNYESYSRQ